MLFASQEIGLRLSRIFRWITTRMSANAPHARKVSTPPPPTTTTSPLTIFEYTYVAFIRFSGRSPKYLPYQMLNSPPSVVVLASTSSACLRAGRGRFCPKIESGFLLLIVCLASKLSQLFNPLLNPNQTNSLQRSRKKKKNSRDEIGDLYEQMTTSAGGNKQRNSRNCDLVERPQREQKGERSYEQWVQFNSIRFDIIH